MIDLKKHLICLVLLAIGTNYGLPAPFLPTFLADRGISTIWTGFIFSVFSIASTLSSVLVGEKVDNAGHSCFLFFSSVTLAASIMAFGALPLIDDTSMLISVAIFLRTIQGKLPSADTITLPARFDFSQLKLCLECRCSLRCRQHNSRLVRFSSLHAGY